MSDTKITATSFDDLFEEERTAGVKGQRAPAREQSADITRAWAKHVDLEVIPSHLLVSFKEWLYVP